MSTTTGLIYTFTGNGKGKTSAALGTALRALSHGWHVHWIALYKEASWKISEFQLAQHLTSSAQKRWQLSVLGKGFYIQQPTQVVETGKNSIKLARTHQAVVHDDNTPSEHRLAAFAALTCALTSLTHTPSPQVLILDEVCNALADKLITRVELESVLKKRGTTHLILTGRNAPRWLQTQSDLVSIIHAKKHPYESGKLAVPGLDF